MWSNVTQKKSSSSSSSSAPPSPVPLTPIHGVADPYENGGIIPGTGEADNAPQIALAAWGIESPSPPPPHQLRNVKQELMNHDEERMKMEGKQELSANSSTVEVKFVNHQNDKEDDEDSQQDSSGDSRSHNEVEQIVSKME